MSSAASSRSKAGPVSAPSCASRFPPSRRASMDGDGGAPIRVVLVDDHAVVRRGLQAFLDTEPDIEVVGDAEGGAEALALVQRLAADRRLTDVVLMDLEMAPLDGIATTRRIRAAFYGVEIVALTSFSDEDRVHAALEAGASGYLIKDADADEVAGAIRAAHRGELQLDPAVARYLTAALLASPQPDAAGSLTSREIEVLRLVGAGAANKAIAAELGIS